MYNIKCTSQSVQHPLYYTICKNKRNNIKGKHQLYEYKVKVLSHNDVSLAFLWLRCGTTLYIQENFIKLLTTKGHQAMNTHPAFGDNKAIYLSQRIRKIVLLSICLSLWFSSIYQTPSMWIKKKTSIEKIELCKQFVTKWIYWLCYCSSLALTFLRR